ncbi:hypothetical protein EVAR_66150_1 [Eumeta japonica]|uniref:Uncharacterized protein n=1 Tax=Eumeta variegata TaxID=151549 RepID=A0A4C1Z175_EUMVA|nr:hypothetical protein EVAR_66150_1 [Eumeta japonica]
MRTIKALVVTAAHGHSQFRRSHQCGVGLLDRSRISNEGSNRLKERGGTDEGKLWDDGGLVGRNSHSLDENRQQKLLRHACIL